MSSDGGKSKRQDDYAGADISDEGTSQNKIAEMKKRREAQNKMRCKRYRDKKKKETIKTVRSIYKEPTSIVEKEEVIKRRKEYDKQRSQRYRDKKRASNLFKLQTEINFIEISVNTNTRSCAEMDSSRNEPSRIDNLGKRNVVKNDCGGLTALESRIIKQEPENPTTDDSEDKLGVMIEVKLEPIETEPPDFNDDVATFEFDVVKREPDDITTDDPLDTAGTAEEGPAAVKHVISAAAIKQEMDIEPTVLQQPDIYFMPLPCKSEPVEGHSRKLEKAGFELNKKILMQNSSLFNDKEETLTSNLKKKTKYRQRIDGKKKTLAQTKSLNEQKKRKAANSKAYRERKKRLKKEWVLAPKYSTQESSVLGSQSQLIDKLTKRKNIKKKATMPKSAKTSVREKKFKNVIVEKNSVHESDESLEGNQLREKNKMISKTDAQRSKEYRERQKAKNMKNKIPPKTDAQRSKEYRERQKAKDSRIKLQAENVDRLQSTSTKTSAEYMKEYRRKKRLKNQITEFNTLLTENYSIAEGRERVLTQAEGSTQAQKAQSEEQKRMRDAANSKAYRERKKQLKEEWVLAQKYSTQEPSVLGAQRLEQHDGRHNRPQAQSSDRQHSAQKPHCCEICDKPFICKSALRTHVLTHSGEKPHCCEICNKYFSSKYVLKTHVLIHSSDRKPYSCEICKKCFSSKYVLKAHVLAHSREKPICCEICKECFSEKSDLKSHFILVHSGEKPYSCEICKKSFPYKYVLRTHVLTHFREKPYCCEVCKKCFSSKYFLRTHVLTHSSENPHCCEICRKCFSSKYAMRTHVSKHYKK